MINNNLIPAKTYTRVIDGEVDGKDKNLKIILKVYDEPIRSTNTVNIHSSFVIMDGENEWGHGLLPNQIEEDEAESILDQLSKNINLHKNKSGQVLNKIK